MTCLLCKTNPRSGAHHNVKYCHACRAHLRKERRAPNFTEEQKAIVYSMAGKAPRKAIAQKAGCKLSMLKNFCRQHNLSMRWSKYSPQLTAEVIAHYENYGRASLKEAYPDICYRSIIDRVKHKPRFAKWTDRQIRQCAILAGLTDRGTLARYFNRPNTHIGSIDAVISKRLRIGPATVHGITLAMGKYLLRPGFPTVRVQQQTDSSKKRYIVLWSDAVEWLLPETPQVIIDAFATMAHFQATLFRGKDPRTCIEEIVRRLKKGLPLD